MASSWRCSFGWHAMEWQFDDDDSHPCSQIGHCKRCGTTKTRFEHERSNAYEYQAPDSCVTVRVCLRCGDRSGDFIDHVLKLHQWTEWEQIQCIQKRICTRCSEEEEKIVHSWVEVADPQSGELKTICQRCNNPEHRQDNTSAKQKPSPKNLEARYAEILGLSTGFSAKELKKAYHHQQANYHPDKVAHLGKDLQKLAEARSKEINEAYEYLKNKFN